MRYYEDEIVDTVISGSLDKSTGKYTKQRTTLNTDDTPQDTTETIQDMIK